MEKELDSLIRKLTTIQGEIGAKDSPSSNKKKLSGDAFMSLKDALAEDFHQTKLLITEVYERPKGRKKGGNPRELIKQQQAVRENVRQLGEDLKELEQQLQKDSARKKKKLSTEELTLRREILEWYTSELEHVKERCSTTYRQSAAASSSRFSPSSPSMNDFMSSSSAASGNAAASGEKEAITADQSQVMLQIEKNDQEMDKMVDQIGTGVHELGVLARGINEELEKQGVMLDGLEEKIDSAQEHVVNINAKMKDTLKKVGRSGDKFMMDFICLVILLGVLAVAYNMVKDGAI